MRLTAKEIEAIKSSILHLDANAQIYLFGSRVAPEKKGGDIDLLIISKTLQNDDRLNIKAAIFCHIDEQKIDIIIAPDDTDPFVRIALSKGKQL